MKSLRQVLEQPVRLALVTGTGLIAALVSDGIGDVLGWLCLAYVVGIACRHALSGMGRGRTRR